MLRGSKRFSLTNHTCNGSGGLMDSQELRVLEREGV